MGIFKLSESFLPKNMSYYFKKKMTHIVFNAVGCDWKRPSYVFPMIFLPTFGLISQMGGNLSSKEIIVTISTLQETSDFLSCKRNL